MEQEGEPFLVECTLPPGVFKTMMTLVGLPIEQHEDIFDSPPRLTWGLIGLATVLSVLAFYNPALYNSIQFVPSEGWGQWITHGFTVFFVHGDWIHLLGNMYVLWVFGDNVEDELGKVKYLTLIVLATVLASWAHGYFADFSSQPVVGALVGIAFVFLFTEPLRSGKHKV